MEYENNFFFPQPCYPVSNRCVQLQCYSQSYNVYTYKWNKTRAASGSVLTNILKYANQEFTCVIFESRSFGYQNETKEKYRRLHDRELFLAKRETDKIQIKLRLTYPDKNLPRFYIESLRDPIRRSRNRIWDGSVFKIFSNLRLDHVSKFA